MKGKRRKPNSSNPARTAPAEADVVWIKTEPTLDGKSFMVVIDIDDDHSLTLTRENANTYAYALLEAVARASYDAAVYAQISDRMPEKALYAGQLVMSLRDDRPPIDFSVMEPMSFTPGVNKKGKPFLLVNFKGEPVGQWVIKDARAHALMVLEAIVVAELDSGYLRNLRGFIGLEEGLARAVVDGLRNYRKGYML